MTINKKYIISGGLRSYARNQGMNHLKQYADNNTIVHFIDCDQIVNINTFKYLEKKYFNTQCKNNVVGTLRYNILKNNTVQSDIRYKKFTPNWDTMYTNFLSLNYNLINTNKKFIMFNELFTKWGHEDLLYNYEIFKLNNKKVNYFFNKIYPTKHFEHKENTDSGIKNLQIIQQLYPELYSWINKKIKSLNSEKRSGF